MTVRELIELLKQVENQDRVVIVSGDSEGNRYSPLDGISLAAYVADSTWSGECGMEALTEEDAAGGYTEEDIVDGDPCIVLCPVN